MKKSFAAKANIFRVLIFFFLLIFVGCTSVPLKIPVSPASNQNYKKLGQSRGHASGFILFGFIPIGQNGKFKAAYMRAVRNKAGDALLNPSIQEQWRWTPFGNIYRIIVRGDVIKYQSSTYN